VPRAAAGNGDLHNIVQEQMPVQKAVRDVMEPARDVRPIRERWGPRMRRRMRASRWRLVRGLATLWDDLRSVFGRAGERAE